ncbi:MAG: SAM-dependent methyltransferase [Flavobacteriales bacterium]|jgi:SAM-dependent methyltransferase
MTAQQLADNRAMWDGSVEGHVAGDFYRVSEFLAGRDPIPPYERAELGDVSGLDVLHLQCHFGQDTLALARSGATVTGVDFSGEAIAAAERLAEQAGLEGTFLESDVYAAHDVLDGAMFDLVYVNVGALCWLPSVARWAEVVTRALRPGGTLYLRDVHPVIATIEEVDGRLEFLYPYSVEAGVVSYEDGLQYASENPPRPNHQWSHSLGEIITSIVGAGMQVEWLKEHFAADWQALPAMAKIDDWMFALPEPLRDRVPMTFSLRATLPG